MNTRKLFLEFLGFHGWLFAALIPYGVLLAVSRIAPPKQKRFLVFIALAAMIFLLLSIPPLSYFDGRPHLGLSLLALVLPVPVFLVSFGQFFIKGSNPRIAAAAIVLQILGIGLALCHFDRVIRCWAI